MEVRRCARCKVPALVEVGCILRCQACSAKLRLRSRLDAMTMIVLSIIFLVGICAIQIGALVRIGEGLAPLAFTFLVFGPFYLWFGIMLAVGVRWLRAPARNPIVPDAEPPPMRHVHVDLHTVPRRCAKCGESAPLESTTRHRVNGLPFGTVWRYRCTACDHHIALRSTWYSMQPELIILVAVAQLVVPIFTPEYTRWLLLVAAATIAIVALSVRRARVIAHRNPPAIAPARARYGAGS